MSSTKNFCRSLIICSSNSTKFQNKSSTLKLNNLNRVRNRSHMLYHSQKTNHNQMNSKVDIQIKILSRVLLSNNRQYIRTILR